MNFLMTITYKDSWYALPQEKRSEIVGQVVAYHEKYLKEGKLKDTYSFAGGILMSVWNVDSLEEFVLIQSEHPYSVLVNYESAPFLDHQEVVTLMGKLRNR
ncbi:MAG TPA: hypothetical protein G4O15_07295 [Dehalococcoidia bacterium]|nr:hypothetical protein [Dehalococcoidia bacterium]